MSKLHVPCIFTKPKIESSIVGRWIELIEMAGSSSSVGGAIFDNLETRNFIFQQICETVLFFEPYEEYGMKKNWLKLCLSLVLIAGFGFQSVLAEQGIVHTLIPTG